MIQLIDYFSLFFVNLTQYSNKECSARVVFFISLKVMSTMSGLNMCGVRKTFGIKIMVLG